MIMDGMKYRYSKLEEEILPIIKDPENTELDQLRNNLENAKREVEKAELVQDGSAKLQEIRDTRPENINEYNQACKEEYCKRYETQILKSNSGGWDIRAKIRGQRYASYQAELIFEEGTVIGKHAYQRRPEHESHTFRRRPDGIFDNEIDYQGTKPLKHSIITFNMINDCLEHLRSEGHDITKWKLIKYKGENIVEPKSKYVIDSFTDKGNKKKIWEKGTPGYEAWAKTLVGAGKFYLAAHHYDNTEIKSIELETYEEIQGKNAFTVQYHATYNFGDKNE
jgi:hypothetical protein